MNKMFIGIDAGGSSTKATSFTLEGEIIATAVGGPGSPVISFQNYFENIKETLITVIGKSANYQVAMVVVGLSGYDAITDFNLLKTNLEKIAKAEVIIVTDLHIALSDVLEDVSTSGAVVIAGTGSAILACKKGSYFLAGGYGQLIRERGSSYAAVHQTCLNIIDKYETKTAYNDFEIGFMASLGINKVSDFKHLFYDKGKDYLAHQVIYIKEKANEGNFDAQLVLINEGKELAKQLIKAIKYLDLETPVLVGLHGGFITKNGDYVIKGLFSELEKNLLEVTIKPGLIDPLRGAYYIAKKRWKDLC